MIIENLSFCHLQYNIPIPFRAKPWEKFCLLSHFLNVIFKSCLPFSNPPDRPSHTQVIFLFHSFVYIFLSFRMSGDGTKMPSGACDSSQLPSTPESTSDLWKPRLNSFLWQLFLQNPWFHYHWKLENHLQPSPPPGEGTKESYWEPYSCSQVHFTSYLTTNVIVFQFLLCKINQVYLVLCPRSCVGSS